MIEKVLSNRNILGIRGMTSALLYLGGTKRGDGLEKTSPWPSGMKIIVRTCSSRTQAHPR